MTKKQKQKIGRRTFLKTAASGAAVTAAAAAAPWVWVKNPAFAAATPAFGTAKHVLVLYAGGGLRSIPLFNADVSFQNNPFGAAPNVAAGTNWGVGAILGTQPVDLFTIPNEQLPPVSAIANDISVIAGIDHEPTSPNAQIDHFAGDVALTGGSVDADAGLLTMVHRDHPGYVSGQMVLPPFDFGLSTFARGEGDYSSYRPIAVQTAQSLSGKSGGGEQVLRAEWAVAMRNEFDEPFIAKRAPHVRPYLAAARDAKINSRAFTSALHDPALDLLGAPEAASGGFTNDQLLDVLGRYSFPESTWALETACALRLFQFGVPMVTIMRYLFDMHSDEKTVLPVDGGDIGRQIAGLHYLLKRMTGSDGNPLWDSTVVVVVSEFGRDNVMPGTGFNSADGSDHQGSPGSRNQCWPIFGGPIPGGQRLGQLDANSLNVVGGSAFPVRRVLATLFDVLGMDPGKYWADGALTELWL